MKKPVLQNNIFNDDDIKALLDDNESTKSPADLDQLIIAASKVDVSNGQPNRTRSATTGTFSSGPHRYLAAACVAMLVFTAVPLMKSSLRQPMEQSGEQSGEQSMDQAETRDFLSSGSKESMPPVPATSKSLLKQQDVAVISEAQVKSDTDGPIASGRMSSIETTAADVQIDNSVMSPTEIRQTFAEFPYRRTKESWQREIIRLNQEKEYDKSRLEKTLFDVLYPEVN